MTSNATSVLAVLSLETETTLIEVPHRKVPVMVDHHRPVVTLPNGTRIAGEWHKPDGLSKSAADAARTAALASGSSLAGGTVRDGTDGITGYRVGNIGWPR